MMVMLPSVVADADSRAGLAVLRKDWSAILSGCGARRFSAPA
jgi:hypothetical protein